MKLPGILCHHDSTVRPDTWITARRHKGLFAVRIDTANATTYLEPVATETRARERFEAVVTNHENGDPQ